MNEINQRKDRLTEIFKSVNAEATAFYRLVVTTATAFLGGTIVFWEHVSPKLTTWSLALLGAGWVLLVLCIAVVVWVRRDNIEVGRLTLSDKLSEAEQMATRSRNLTTLSGVFLAAGMLFVALAALVSLGAKAMAENDRSGADKKVTLKAIPYPEFAKFVPASTPSPKVSGSEDKDKDKDKDKGKGEGESGTAGESGSAASPKKD